MLELPSRAAGRVFNMAEPLVDRHVAEGRGALPALRLADGDVSYAELQATTNRVGNALRTAGVSAEQRVAMLLPDGLEFVATFIGAMKIGAVPVPMNTAASPAEVRFMLADSRARALVVHADVLKQLQLLDTPEAASEGPRTVLVVGTEHAAPLSFSAAIEPASPHLETYPAGVDEPCYWLYSSGTTGRSKGVVHLHGDMLACVTPFATEIVRIEPHDSTFSVARLFFSYGLVNSLFLPLLAGATSILSPRRPDPTHTLEVVRRHRPTLFFSVPSAYAQVCAAVEASDQPSEHPFGSVRLAISAGEPLPEPIYARWRSLTGVEVLDGLGSTEVGYIFCSNRPGRIRPGSSGQMLGDHQARIVDDHGLDADSGELWVKSASTALHYWNQRERSRQTFVGEWLRTGDRYHRDADGYLWYQGRIDDVFKVNGQWVSPLEVESCLLSHPAVQECAVVAAPDQSGLAKPRAFVVRRAGTRVEAPELQALVRARLQAYKSPRWVEFVNELPRTASGKVQRFVLRDQALERPAGGVSAAGDASTGQAARSDQRGAPHGRAPSGR